MSKQSKPFHDYSTKEILFDIGLYQEIELSLMDFSIDKSTATVNDGFGIPREEEAYYVEYPKDFVSILEFINNTINVHHYCPDCGRENSFKYICSFPRKVSTIKPTMVIAPATISELQADAFQADVEAEDIEDYVNTYFPNAATSHLESDIKTLLGGKTFTPFTVEMECTHNPVHNYKFYFLIQRKYIGFEPHYYFSKVGQYPSVADFQQDETQKYRKVLADLGFDKEYAKAIGLYSHGIGIGSYVYLRRIIEEMVDEAAQTAIADGKLDEDEFKYVVISKANEPERKRQRRFEEKIKLLPGYLPPLLVENAGYYGIVSKGIHELSEETCKEYFPVLNAAILMMSQQAYDIREQGKHAESLKSSLISIQDKEKSKKGDE